MGQYQQWLQYREQDQQLRARLEQLEVELTALQARAHLLAAPGSYEQNPLLRLLLQAACVDAVPPVQSEQPVASTHGEASGTPGATEAGAEETPALFSWNGLPDVNLPDGREAAVPSSPLPRPEIELLPEDMVAFLDEHTQTSPQLQLPWWLRQPVSASAGNTQARAADQENMRNNRDIARWLERWGRQPAAAEQEGDTPHA